MPRIESISKLRDHAREISDYCHKEDEPVYLTTNGKGDLVVLSVGNFERMQSELDLMTKLGTTWAEEAKRKKWISHAQMMKLLQDRINRSAP